MLPRSSRVDNLGFTSIRHFPVEFSLFPCSPSGKVRALFESAVMRGQRTREIHFAQGLTEVDLDRAAERRKRQIIRLRPEGLLNFVPQRIQAKERVRDQADNEGRRQPNRVNQAKWQEKAVQVRGSMQQERVGERDRC